LYVTVFLFIIFLVFGSKKLNPLKTKQQLNPTKEQKTNHFYLYHSTLTIQIQNLLQINQMKEEQKNQKPKLKKIEITHFVHKLLHTKLFHRD